MINGALKFFGKPDSGISIKKPILYALISSFVFVALVFVVLFIMTSLQSQALQKKEETAMLSVQYLNKVEAVMVEPESKKENPMVLSAEFEYIQVIDGCGPYFEGGCLNVRSGPGLDFPVVLRLRNGAVLKVESKVEQENMTWYKIVFDELIRYPKRLTGDWYVAVDYVRELTDEGHQNLSEKQSITTTKRIIIDLSKQMLYAYDGEELFTEEIISTGVELNPTPRGEFVIFRKTPSRYMQGPLPGISDDEWDLPGVPWNLYFSRQGAAIHGTYWHNNFGQPSSHGCVNLPPERAEILYKWADLGTRVIVKN